MRRYVALTRKSSLKRIGKKGKEWARERAKLKKEFAGTVYCEVRLPGICQIYATDPAHSRKRRNLGKWGTEERRQNLRAIVAACRACHDWYEKRGESVMRPAFEAIAQRRQENAG